MPTTIQLSAWAVPAFMDESPIDHTWVTSYDNRTQNFADVAETPVLKPQGSLQTGFFLWLDRRHLNKLDDARGSRESYSDVILRLVELEVQRERP